jgi:hypothetical protein
MQHQSRLHRLKEYLLNHLTFTIEDEPAPTNVSYRVTTQVQHWSSVYVQHVACELSGYSFTVNQF